MADQHSEPAINYARIEEIINKSVEAIRAKEENSVAFRFEYQVAVDIIKLLSDIRFRCIVFVTAIVTAATAFLPQTVNPGMRPVLGLLGILATLGITIYELRNSQLYEVAIHRAKTLEERLQMKGSDPSETLNKGLFAERPKYVGSTKTEKGDQSRLLFWFIPVKHDYGLALIYGAALGAWVYLFVYGVLALPVPAGLWEGLSAGYLRLLSALLGIAAGAWSICQFVIHDKRRVKKPISPPKLVPAATR